MIFDGMMQVFKYGEIVKTDMTEAEKAEETAQFFASVAAEFDSEINFTYCTEFIVGRDPEVTTEPNELRLFLETLGDCVVVVDDEEIIKVHVHTEQPGVALTKALEFGSLLTVKIENMKEQHKKAAELNNANRAAYEAAQASKEEKETLKPVSPEEELGFGCQRRPDDEPQHGGHCRSRSCHPGKDGFRTAEQQKHHPCGRTGRAARHRPQDYRRTDPHHSAGSLRTLKL